ncbi:MAG: DUF192 domain-containing protein [bacterium]|nr:DUF192 domain-containing protein [bacterium]MDT8395516.1 hypothetical protein [bacterium]
MNALVNSNTGQVILDELDVRSTFFGRLTGYALRGFINCPGMLFLDTPRVHTLGMLFPLDLYFFDTSLRLLGSSQAIRPMKFPRSPRGTRHILEIPHHAHNLSVELEAGEQVSILWSAG